jgi:beta-xylosidase
MLTNAMHRVHANPVYEGYFADPFAWQHDGVYYAIGTGELEAEGRTPGLAFPVLRSFDFYHWEYIGNALERLSPALGDNYWAPAVACAEGRFFLYYSVGHGDKNHQLRVAVSDAPGGPYRDSGKTLISADACPFAIDPDPFQDSDGRWYLFYARDFLDCTDTLRAGTALAVAPMKSMTELEAPGTVVLRARCDWQRFQSERPMYGQVWDWHTLEGPCVHKHVDRYYCFYSGGRWEDDTYGVDYGAADTVLGPYSDQGNERGPRVLRTVPGKVLGPGHNSLIRGPDGRTDYLVYHAWDNAMRARRMFMDPVVWTSDGPRCQGPTLGSA